MEGGSDMNELLGNQIKILRNARNLTQEYMAEKLGISRQKYARIENGNNNITLEVLTRISDILDVAVGDITNILDKDKSVAYRGGISGMESAQKIFDMLDLFYANKHLYMHLQPVDESK